MAIGDWIAAGALSLGALLWLLSLLQLAKRSKDLEFRIAADSRPDAPTSGGLISVIIPARNEAHNIEACVASVLAQSYTSLEVIVLDDGSTDGTGDLVQKLATDDSRVKHHQGEPRPEGWMGKVWACHTAQRHAKGDALLFIDADVRLEPEAIRQALAYMRDGEVAAISALGKLTLVSFWEWVVQPVIGGLIVQNNDPREVNDPDLPDKVMANGQFILATREAYDRIDGHESIRGEILDDVSFARRCKAEGVRYNLVYGRELFSCRMYHSLGEIWEGWTKNLFAGLDFRLWIALAVVFVLGLMNIAPFFALLSRLALSGTGLLTDGVFWAALANVTLMYASYAGGLRAAGYRLTYVWSYPIGVLVTMGIFLNSAFRIVSGKGVSWKGRVYTTTSTRQSKQEDESNA